MATGTHNGATTYRWCLVALAFSEVLTATGVMFGWSAMSLALQREGVYASLCDASWLLDDGPCDAQVLRLNVIYSAAATCIPLSFMAWGPAMDKWGAKAVRLASLAFFIGGTLLFAFASAGDSVVDAYTVAGCLVSFGGGGFFFSHFVIAEHFKGSHFGLAPQLVREWPLASARARQSSRLRWEPLVPGPATHPSGEPLGSA